MKILASDLVVEFMLHQTLRWKWQEQIYHIMLEIVVCTVYPFLQYMVGFPNVVRFVLWQGGKDSLRIQLAEMIMRVPEEDLQKTVASVMKDLWIEMEKGWRSRCLSICIYLPLSFSLQFGDLVNVYTSFASSQT